MLALAGGCGKSDLRSSASSARRGPFVIAPQRRPTDREVPLALPLTAARAASFASAVELVPVDIAGASPQRREGASPGEEREAAQCGGTARPELGAGRSPQLVRGVGLARETMSSSVEVLASAAAVRGDLDYADSRAGIECYGKVLRNTLVRDQDERVHVQSVTLARLSLPAPSGQTSTGIRIEAHVGVSGTGVAIPVYLDALSFGYGPAEIDLFATSFVQPEPVKIEQQLLTLLWQRARLHQL
jgi:hypothetical protein